MTRFLPRKVLKRGSVIRRLQEGCLNSHSYSPQKVRPEDGRERQKTSLGVSYSVFCTRNMNYITGELRDISQMTLLSGRPRQSEPEQGLSQGLVICEQGKLPPLQ